MSAAETGPALSPWELWEHLLVQRGFLSSPAGPRDAYRSRPATLPADLSGPGSPVGKGYETLAILQLADKDGHRVGPLGLGFFEHGGADRHAEAQAIRGLRRHGPSSLPRGKLTVVVETPVCPSCASRLVAYARDTGLAAVDTYVPERPSMTGPGMARPKTSARTAAMAGRPALQLRFQGLALGR